MIDVARIDHWAASGTGPFHKSSTLSKVLFLIMAVGAAVLARRPGPLVIGYCIILAASAAARLPWMRMAFLSLSAAVFALLYGISLQGGIAVYGLLLFKAVTPSFAVAALIVSTPYPKIFSLLSTLLPEVLAAGLFMTYRTLFILLDMMNNFIAAIRLRGGFSAGSLVNNSANVAKGVAMLVVLAVERSSRIYAVMTVRGYSGSMARSGMDPLRREDWLPLGIGIIVLALAALWT